MSTPDGIEAFTLAAVERLGGAAEQEAIGLYTVLWPGGADLTARRLTLDPETLEEAPGAELVTFGSPVLEELIGLATASGRVACGFLTVPATASQEVRQRLVRSFRWIDVSWAPETARPWWLASAVFLFRARYRSDACEEELHEIAVSLGDCRILRRLVPAIERYRLTPDPPDAWPMVAELPPGVAYGAARDELQRRLLSPLGMRRRELEARLARESGRAIAYYDELVREVTEQLSPLPAATPERTRLEGRRTAIRLERASRVAELRAKYRLELEIALLSVLRLHLPRLVFRGVAAGKRDRALLTLVWDPVEQAAEPVRCQQCRALTYEVALVRGGVIACPACVAAKSGSPNPRGSM